MMGEKRQFELGEMEEKWARDRFAYRMIGL
jgi:hypothetical protein